MRRLFRTMLVGLLVLSLLCSAAGCTGGSKTDEGYWVITAYREEGETYKGDELLKIGMDGYLVLEKGGSGFLVISGSGAYEITWGDGKIEGSRFGLDFTRSGSTLTANGRRTDDMEGVVFTFEKSKDAAPARPAGIITTETPIQDSKEESHAEESSAAEVSQAEASQEKSSQADSSQEESSKEESSQEESSQAESSAEESSAQESSKQESSIQESSAQESSKQESSKPETVVSNKIQGYYETVLFEVEGESISGEDLKEVELYYMLALEDGGTGYFVLFGQNSGVHLVWDEKTIDMGVLFMEYTFDGTDLKAHMTSGAEEIGDFTFHKISDEIPAAPGNLLNYLENTSGNETQTMADLPEFLQITNPSPTAPTGGYVVTTYYIDGEEYLPDGNGIIFYENGKAELNFTGEKETTDWTYVDGVLSIQASDGVYKGTLTVDGDLRLADSYFDNYYYTMEPGMPNFAQQGAEADPVDAVVPFIGEYQGFLHVYNTVGFGGYMEDGLETISPFFARIGVNADGTPFVGFQAFYDAVHAFTPMEAAYVPEDEAISVKGQFLGIPFEKEFTRPQEDGSYRIIGTNTDGKISYDYEIFMKPLDADWTVEEVLTYTDGKKDQNAENYIVELSMFKGDDLEARLKEYAAVLDPDGEVDLSMFEFDKNVYNAEMNGGGPDTLKVQYLDDEQTLCWMYDAAIFQESDNPESGERLVSTDGNVFVSVEYATAVTDFTEYTERLKMEEATGNIENLKIEELKIGLYDVTKCYYRISDVGLEGVDYLVVLDEKMAHGYYGVDVIVYDELQRPERVDNDVIRGLIASLQLN